MLDLEQNDEAERAANKVADPSTVHHALELRTRVTARRKLGRVGSDEHMVAAVAWRL